MTTPTHSTSEVRTVDFQKPDAADAFVRSIRDTGFAILTNHPVSVDLLNTIDQEWRAFFASDAKHQYRFDGEATDAQFGYFSLETSERAVGHDEKDIKEFFQVGPGGPIPETLAHNVNQYRADGLALASTLLGWIDAALPADHRFDAELRLAHVLSDPISVLRILHYPPLTGREPPGSLRAAPHEDINLITLLPVADEPGLQVQTKDGRWLDLHGRPGEMIINTGDMLQEFTGGYLPSTTHRVVNPDIDRGNRARISMPFFLAPELDVRLSERYTAGEYLSERVAEISGRET